MKREQIDEMAELSTSVKRLLTTVRCRSTKQLWWGFSRRRFNVGVSARKVETFKNFVNGKWSGARDGATFEDRIPRCVEATPAISRLHPKMKRSDAADIATSPEAYAAGRSPELHLRVPPPAQNSSR
jgi:hypothetical protein